MCISLKNLFLCERVIDTKNWKALPTRKDRTPNELNGVDQLLAASQVLNHPMNAVRPKLFMTPAGSINGDGLEGSFSSPILGMDNPNLYDALEPNIAPLVMIMRHYAFITYTSCQGHTLNGEVHEAHVGAIYDLKLTPVVWDFLRAAEVANFQAFRLWLTDADDGKRYPTVELYYPVPTGLDWERYHGSLRSAIAAFQSILKGNIRRSTAEV